MSSILTNASSMSALQTLRSISSGLETAQNQVSSGLRVSKASDNAAYWSISTTMSSDKGSLSAVQDAIGLGQAKLDTAYSGLDATVELLGEVKRKIVAAFESGVDRSKVQNDIEQLKQQSVSIAKSASFSGQNFLDTIGSSLSNSTYVVSSFGRTAAGVFVGTTDIDLEKVSLYNDGGTGLLQGTVALPTPPAPPVVPVVDIGQIGGLMTFSGSDASGYLDGPIFDSPFRVENGDVLKFEYQVSGVSYTLNIDRAIVDYAVPGKGGLISTPTHLSMVINRAIDTHKAAPSDPITLLAWGNATQLFFVAFPIGSALSVGPTTATVGPTVPPPSPPPSPPPPPPKLALADIDVSMPDADLDVLLSSTERMLKQVTDAAAYIGSIQSSQAGHADFANSLSNAISKGIGRLVDADMNEASTRLKAIQAQKQLAISSLQISNANGETISELFR